MHRLRAAAAMGASEPGGSAGDSGREHPVRSPAREKPRAADCVASRNRSDGGDPSLPGGPDTHRNRRGVEYAGGDGEESASAVAGDVARESQPHDGGAMKEFDDELRAALG